MIPWEAISASCALAAIISGGFAVYLRLTIKDQIRTAVNGFATRLAVLEEKVEKLEENLKELDEYAHARHHEWANKANELEWKIIEAVRYNRGNQ